MIDDKLAFVGGLDLTSKRWDTCDHKAGDPRRAFEDSALSTVPRRDGGGRRRESSTEILEVARERWRAATGEEIRRP